MRDIRLAVILLGATACSEPPWADALPCTEDELVPPPGPAAEPGASAEDAAAAWGTRTAELVFEDPAAPWSHLEVTAGAVVDSVEAGNALRGGCHPRSMALDVELEWTMTLDDLVLAESEHSQRRLVVYDNGELAAMAMGTIPLDELGAIATHPELDGQPPTHANLSVGGYHDPGYIMLTVGYTAPDGTFRGAHFPGEWLVAE